MAKDDENNTPEEKPDRKEEVFMREVDDAVREEDLRNFMQKYGLWIGGLLIIGLSGLAGWIFYNNNLDEKSGIRSEEYVAAIDSVQQNNLDGAATALEPLKDAEQEGYRAASKMMKANIALERQDAKAAIAGYKEIVSDGDLPQPFRDLALVRQTVAEFDEMEPQKVVDRLKPLAVPGNPWFGSAGEMVAISYLAMGKTDLAGPLFAQIAKDEAVPQTIRSRALQMAGQQGIDAVELESDEEAKASPVTATPVEGDAQE